VSATTIRVAEPEVAILHRGFLRAKSPRLGASTRARREINALIKVNTAPQPSRHYGDAVCVAGIALDPLRWVRPYPAPFRYLENRQTLRKYDVDRTRGQWTPPQ